MNATSEKEPHIRLATPEDAEQLLAIYAPYVEKTAISFEWETPDVEEFRKRIKNTLKKYPYLLAEQEGEILGYACIGYPEREDGYLTLNSVRFHERMGYSMVGKFHNCGYKFGNWYHMVWMEKKIGAHIPDPSPVIPFSRLTAF